MTTSERQLTLAADPIPASRVSVELVPRSVESVIAETRQVAAGLPGVDTINVPQLMRFPLHSWQACAAARDVPRADRSRFATIPHLRASGLAPDAPLAMAEYLESLTEVLIISGDPPEGFSGESYDVRAIQAIRRIAKEHPHLRIYAALDPYRQSISTELEYLERKLEVGAVGFFTQPFFDADLMRAWSAIVPREAEIWWGATTVTTPSSMTYWRRRNQVPFPRAFQPTLEWNRQVASEVIAFARSRGDHAYLMPVRTSVMDFLDGLL